MSPLPGVTALTRERVARKFDRSGPDACMAEIAADLKQHNPELLDMILKCVIDLGNWSKVMQGLGMFVSPHARAILDRFRQIATGSIAARHTGNARPDREANRRD